MYDHSYHYLFWRNKKILGIKHFTFYLPRKTRYGKSGKFDMEKKKPSKFTLIPLSLSIE